MSVDKKKPAAKKPRRIKRHKFHADPDMPGYEEITDFKITITRRPVGVLEYLKGVIHGWNERRRKKSVPNTTKKGGRKSNGRTSQQSRKKRASKTPAARKVQKPRTRKASPRKKNTVRKAAKK